MWAPDGSPRECHRDVKTKAHEVIPRTVVHLGVLRNEVIREESRGRTDKCCEKQAARKCMGGKEGRSKEEGRRKGGSKQ